MSSRISFNANAQSLPDRGYFTEVVTALKPKTILIMDGLDVADDIYNRLGGKSVVVHRNWSPTESEIWDKRSPNYKAPEVLVDGWRKEGYPHIVRNLLNEPAAGDYELPLVLEYMIDVMRRAADIGYKVLAGNFSVGSINPYHYANGTMREYLYWLGELGHFAGWHEYSNLILDYGHGQTHPNDLFDKNLVQPNLWDRHTMSSLPVRKWGNDYPPYWLLRRSTWNDIFINEYNKANPNNKIKPHFNIVSEFGLDYVPDGEGIIARFSEHLKNRYGFGHPRRVRAAGWECYRSTYADYFPGRDFEELIAEQIEKVEPMYPENYLGFDLFTWSGRPDWDEEGGFNITGYKKLHKKLIEKQMDSFPNIDIHKPVYATIAPQPGETPVPPPPPPPVVVTPPPVIVPPSTPAPSDGKIWLTAKLKPSLNLREAPDTKYPVVEKVLYGVKFECIEGEACLSDKIGKTGRWIEVLTPSGKKAWTAAWLVVRV